MRDSTCFYMPWNSVLCPLIAAIVGMHFVIAIILSAVIFHEKLNRSVLRELS